MPGDALAAEPAIGLGVRERDDAVPQLLLDEPGELAVRPDLEPLLVRIVGDLQTHGTSRSR